MSQLEKVDKPTSLGARLRLLRKERFLTLREFADRVGCDPGYLSQLENGKAVNPSDRFLLSVNAKFLVRPDWLKTGKGKPFAEPVTTETQLDVDTLRYALTERLQTLRQAVAAVEAELQKLAKYPPKAKIVQTDIQFGAPD